MSDGEPVTRSRPRAAYVVTFVALAAITLLEVGVARADASGAARVTALAGLAMAKAAALLLVFMHLRVESRALRLIAFAPIVIAPVFAVVLMLDTVFRVVGPAL